MPAISSSPALEAVDLTKTYRVGRQRHAVHALAGATFAAATGSVFGLLGPNGAGKSTIVKILSTLAKADSGTARVGMWNEIERMAAEDAMTVLLTTHYLDEADRLASALAIVDAGRVVASGSPDQLKSELRGDTLVLEFADADTATRAVERLDRMDELRDVDRGGTSIRARPDRGAGALPRVLAVLDDAGLDVGSASVARPTLEDVYLRHTGRSFAAAQDAAALAPAGAEVAR